MKLTPGSLWKHTKTSNLYVIFYLATNCTNAQDGQSMVIYRRSNPNLSSDISFKYFVRELEEFKQKFEFISEVESIGPEDA